MSILTPKQIERQMDRSIDEISADWKAVQSLLETLAAYADVVQKVAEMEDIVLMEDGARLVGNCMFCGGVIGLEEEHEEDCPHVKAKALRVLK